VFALGVRAQMFEEWFKQKKTQKKYLLQQVTALQLYIGYVQKGYSIARNGLNTISNIKDGQFNLHNNFFNSFKSVNPSVRNYNKVADIADLQIKIVQEYNRTFKKIQETGAFNQAEINYIKRVYNRLLTDCAASIDELSTVTSANKLEMKDDERLKRIDVLYQDMQDRYTFLQSFGNETILLASARMKERNDVQTSRSLNGIP